MNVQAQCDVFQQSNESNLDELSRSLLDFYQRDLPLEPRPFATMAKHLGCTEPDVLTKLLALKDAGVLTRIGPVFDHKRAGASLLAAVSVPPEKTEYVASQINSYVEVNHNYGREHAYNLWFVVTAPTQEHLAFILDDMEKAIGYSILRLPMEKAYHIDLGFHVGERRSERPFTQHLNAIDSKELRPDTPGTKATGLLRDELQQTLRELIQDGFPLTRKPFERLALTLNQSLSRQACIDHEQIKESDVINTLRHWVNTGLIKRVGLVTNHHKLGFKHNAMVVWNIPEDDTDRVGKIFKESGLVSLCYKRRRQLPDWPYNLYCMIHSKNRDVVARHIEQLVALAGLDGIQRSVLFSNHQYKQKGGVYTRSARQRRIGFVGPAISVEAQTVSQINMGSFL